MEPTFSELRYSDLAPYFPRTPNLLRSFFSETDTLPKPQSSEPLSPSERAALERRRHRHPDLSYSPDGKFDNRLWCEHREKLNQEYADAWAKVRTAHMDDYHKTFWDAFNVWENAPEVAYWSPCGPEDEDEEETIDGVPINDIILDDSTFFNTRFVHYQPPSAELADPAPPSPIPELGHRSTSPTASCFTVDWEDVFNSDNVPTSKAQVLVKHQSSAAVFTTHIEGDNEVATVAGVQVVKIARDFQEFEDSSDVESCADQFTATVEALSTTDGGMVKYESTPTLVVVDEQDVIKSQGLITVSTPKRLPNPAQNPCTSYDVYSRAFGDTPSSTSTFTSLRRDDLFMMDLGRTYADSPASTCCSRQYPSKPVKDAILDHLVPVLEFNAHPAESLEAKPTRSALGKMGKLFGKTGKALKKLSKFRGRN